MIFSHDFDTDFAQLDFFAEEPWALVRFADGELAILEHRQIRSADGWTVPPGGSPFQPALEASLAYRDPGYHFGISCPCCDEPAARRLRELTSDCQERCTFSNIFVNGNWPAFCRRMWDEGWLMRCALVGSARHCHYRVAANCVNDPSMFDWLPDLIRALAQEKRPILVAAGPASNIIIHRYWATVPADRRRTIVDVGSALDVALHGRNTRGYQDAANPNQRKRCTWTMSEPAWPASAGS